MSYGITRPQQLHWQGRKSVKRQHCRERGGSAGSSQSRMRLEMVRCVPTWPRG